MTSDIDIARKSLTEEREKLVRQLGELGADDMGNLTGDVDYGDGFADAAAATAERTEVLGLVETLKQTLGDVDAALGRIDEGSYGVCSACGKAISAARLEARPTSTMCVECKSAQS